MTGCFDLLAQAINSARCPPFAWSYDQPRPESADSLPGVRLHGDEDMPETFRFVTSDHLEVLVRLQRFVAVPALEWVVEVANVGKTPAGVLRGLYSLDLRIPAPTQSSWMLFSLHGDDCSERSFLPMERPISPGGGCEVLPAGGRSSSHAFPFFNVIQDESQGMLIAIGWTGQWRFGLQRSDCEVHLVAGQQHLQLDLKPGERIRTPRMLIMPWVGSARLAHQRWVQLLREHYSPSITHHPTFHLPRALQNFDRYVGERSEWSTETGQLRNVDGASRCEEFNTYWLDAAWFPGQFPNGVGNLGADPMRFPHGLRGIADSAHAQAMRFALWFEPERVADATEIAREHPQWLLQVADASNDGIRYGVQNAVLNLGDAACRSWLAERLTALIEEYAVDIYRQDCNIDLLPFWLAHDEATRLGMTEIRYVEGLYQLWDHLLKRFPALLIDNCASGGRRLDLETMTRSVTLWRSDTDCRPGRETWRQNQTLGLSQFIPRHATCAWEPVAYDVRSSATGGLAASFAVLDPAFDFRQARKALGDAEILAPYWEQGNFYPLTPATLDDDGWAGYQIHRSEDESGVVVLFRRSACIDSSRSFQLTDIRHDVLYVVEIWDESWNRQQKEMAGSNLGELSITIPNPKNSLLLRYRKQP